MLISEQERVERAARIMEAFVHQSGMREKNGGERYLWTDAFAVCNFVSLYERTREGRWLTYARELVEAVHAVLGAFHPDDARSGRLSGADAEHPTRGGLRIGKPLIERGVGEAYDEQREWDRDGQYFHYLTKWMHALDRMAAVTGEVRYWNAAVELARRAHGAFVYRDDAGRLRMYWKMSADLSRPLVDAMGQHDALDAYVTYLQLAVRGTQFSQDAGLSREIAEAADMSEAMPLATDDPLGIGGLLFDAARTTQLIASYELPLSGMLRALLDAAAGGLEGFAAGETLRRPPQYRLAFRELGIAIGLHGVSLMRALNEGVLHRDVLASQLDAFEAFMPLGEALEMFWQHPQHQSVPSWREHEAINSVMLATALVGDRFLRL